jgi:UDP-GlcNAc3NAcA epimerase
MRLVTIVGARPQFIKAAVVSRAIRAAGGIEESVIHTGQHYDDDMSAVFFDELEMPAPERNLGIGSGSHAVQTARMLTALEASLVELSPDRVLVYGDTNSTLAGALAAAKLAIPVAHVEAGLRSFNRAMPEEINRIAADHVSDLLFPPTDAARERLMLEGLGSRRVVMVGDVMYDAVLHAASRRPKTHDSGAYLLATIHRAENTDDPARLRGILTALGTLAREMQVLLPLHPRTRAAIETLESGWTPPPGVRCVPPQGYLEMQSLEAGARVIVTDSGGVQKEAYWHGVHCVTLRGETEWTELVDAGWNRLAPPSNPGEIVRLVQSALEQPALPRPPLYGDGKAGEKIVAALG